MSYHLTPIPQGTYGELSKVYEEAAELKDAEEQGATLMVLQELSDLIGAIEGYLEKHHPSLTLQDLLRMKEVTARAFKSGARIPASMREYEPLEHPAEFHLGEQIGLKGGNNLYQVMRVVDNNVLLECTLFRASETVGIGVGEPGVLITAVAETAWVQPYLLEQSFVKDPE